MLMKTLWKCIDRKTLNSITKQKLFLLLNVFVWALLSLLVSFVVGRFLGVNRHWLEVTAIIVGYASFGIGFLGGWLFLSNRT